MKIAFDNSIHLGQFSVTDARARLAAKNSQAMISTKPAGDVVAVEAFNENSYSDHIIWTLEREPQDRFYKFMDVFHSVKNIIRVPLNEQDARLALTVHEQLNMHMSNALTCAVAIAHKVNQLHSLYSEFRNDRVRAYLQGTHGILVTLPDTQTESAFGEDDLEAYYRDALDTFRAAGIELSSQFHE
jgi:hypothetical protein